MMHSVRAVASLSLFVVTLLGACRAEAPGRTKPVTPRLHSQLLFGERETSPVVVLLHGFGADGDDLVPLAEFQGERLPFRFLVAEAPLALPYGGRAWWPIDMAAREARLRRGEGLDLRHERPEGVDSARELVDELLGHVEQSLHAPPSRTALLGFSQGAMLAMDTTLHRADGPRCLALLSGTYLSEATWRPRFDKRPHLPIFLSHGRGDTVLPFSLSEALHTELKAQGYPVTFVPFEGGHEIPRPVLGPLVDYLSACFKGI
jgi:phospholipase/carboxylesterase